MLAQHSLALLGIARAAGGDDRAVTPFLDLVDPVLVIPDDKGAEALRGFEHRTQQPGYPTRPRRLGQREMECRVAPDDLGARAPPVRRVELIEGGAEQRLSVVAPPEGVRRTAIDSSASRAS